MSRPEIISWDQAYNRSGDRGLQRAVVNAIRTYMNNHTLSGWVKAETLMQDTGLKERTVREQIAANVAAGWLEVIESGNSSGRANTYRLAYPDHAVHRMVAVEDETDHAVHRMVEGEPCATAQGNHAVHRTPTTPRTSPQEKFSIGTTPENHAVHRMVSDPWGSEEGVTSSTEETATESNHAVHRMVSDPWGSEEGVTSSTEETATESNHAVHRMVPEGAPKPTVPVEPAGFGSCRFDPFCSKPQPCGCGL